jgi:hypothetical protein
MAGVKLQFPGLHAHLTSALPVFFSCGDIRDAKSMPVQSVGPLERNFSVELNNLQVDEKIHPESITACEFLFHEELSYMSVNMEAISST